MLERRNCCYFDNVAQMVCAEQKAKYRYVSLAKGKSDMPTENPYNHIAFVAVAIPRYC